MLGGHVQREKFHVFVFYYKFTLKTVMSQRHNQLFLPNYLQCIENKVATMKRLCWGCTVHFSELAYSCFTGYNGLVNRKHIQKLHYFNKHHISFPKVTYIIWNHIIGGR